MSSTSTRHTYVLANALARNVNKQKKEKKGRSGALANLTPPVPPDWWSGDPLFAGLVPREDQEKDMTIMIDEWPNGAVAGEEDRLQFQWKASNSDTWQDAQAVIPIQGPLESSQFPMSLPLNKSNFAIEGTFDLRYIVTGDTGLATESDKAQFIIDKTPPNDNQSPDALTFTDPAVVSDGITGDYLANHGGVEVQIPEYLGDYDGDAVQIYVHNVGTSPSIPSYGEDLNAARTVTVPPAAFDNLLDGLIYVSYRLLDKVGNHGPHSDNTPGNLLIKPLPVEPLAAPRVPRIRDDQILNLDDIATGTAGLVEIDPDPNLLEGDIVVLTWGGPGVPQLTHEISDAAATILFNVPYGTVLGPVYGAATAVVPTEVSYVVRRGNKPFNSDPATIDVDFFVPGPVNPDRPDPINSKLPTVTVRGTGPNPQNNVLNAEDADLPVSVTLPLYGPIGPGEEMILYWASLDNEVGRFNPVTGAPADSYKFEVTWASIKDLPSGTAVPVFYTVGRSDGTGNVEMCVPTLVDVSAALPIKLAEPAFPDATEAADGSPILTCPSYIGDEQLVTVRIPANPLLAGGETLSFTWQCYTDKLGQAPAGTAQTFDKSITAEQARNGFEFTVGPFADYILPVGRNGSVTLKYVSDTVPSMLGELLIRASAYNSAGVCDPTARRGLKAGRCCC
jgi:hypothetical protein